MELAMERSQEIIAKAHTEFSEIFGRDYDFVEKYRSEDADIIIVAMGSISSTIKDVVDELREAGEKVGLVRVRVFRPFPKTQIYEALKGASKIGVIDKNVSFSIGGVLATEIRSKTGLDVSGFIVGLGGRDIKPSDIKEIIEKTKNPTKRTQWIGLKKEEV
jgi:pyruvate ferredoxin oxidoreductase alpha subunit